jgi:hypothetical protein
LSLGKKASGAVFRNFSLTKSSITGMFKSKIFLQHQY